MTYYCDHFPGLDGDPDCLTCAAEQWQAFYEAVGRKYGEGAADTTAVPATGTYLVIDGKAVPVTSMWISAGPTSDGRTRWGVATKEDADD